MTMYLSLIVFVALLDASYSIINGQDADIKNYPYQLSFMYSPNPWCGAIMLSQTWVLTSAICTAGTTPLDMKIRAGTSDYSNGQVLQIKQIYRHPKFNFEQMDYDVSLIELAENITIENALPIHLVQAGYEPQVGQTSLVTGWGYTQEGGWRPDVLQSIELPILDRDICNGSLDGRVTERMICAGYLEGGKDACTGDHGGPMVIDGFLVGIVSWSYGCARANVSRAYTHIGNEEIRSYIKEISGI